jgi:hypothetical protein
VRFSARKSLPLTPISHLGCHIVPAEPKIPINLPNHGPELTRVSSSNYAHPSYSPSGNEAR